MNLIRALNKRLISDWRTTWHKLRSIQLAAVVAAITAVLVANPVIVVGLIALLPTGPLLYLVAAAVGVFVFVIPAALRLWAQPAPPCPKDADDGNA